MIVDIFRQNQNTFTWSNDWLQLLSTRGLILSPVKNLFDYVSKICVCVCMLFWKSPPEFHDNFLNAITVKMIVHPEKCMRAFCNSFIHSFSLYPFSSNRTCAVHRKKPFYSLAILQSKVKLRTSVASKALKIIAQATFQSFQFAISSFDSFSVK